MRDSLPHEKRTLEKELEAGGVCVLTVRLLEREVLEKRFRTTHQKVRL